MPSKKKRSRFSSKRAAAPKNATPPPSQTSQTSQPKKKADSKEHLKEPWLDAFRKAGTILAASQIVPVSRRTVQEWRKRDRDFASKFVEADMEISERLETTVLHRAINGDTKPLIKNGAVVKDEAGRPVTIREFSDAIQIFLLKCRLPHKYQEKIKQQIDLRIVNVLSSEFLSLIRRHVSDVCPACKTVLGITPKIAKELEGLSAKLGAQ